MTSIQTPSGVGDRPPSLDDQIKQRQLAKLDAEIKNLSRFSFETLAKVLVAVLAIVAAAWTLYLGIPQGKLDLAKVHQELIDKSDEAKRQGAIAEANSRAASGAAQELRNKQAELSETENLRLGALDALSRLQMEAESLAAQNAKLQKTSGRPLGKEAQLQNAAAAQPRIFIQFAGGMDRDHVIEPLRRSLAAQHLVVPPAERINRGQKNEVRYFVKDASQERVANQVAEVTLASLKASGCPIGSLPVRFVELPEGKQGPVELWLLHNCPPA